MAFGLASCMAGGASAQTLSITNTMHVPSSPRAGQDVFIETQTSPTGAAVEAYSLFGVEENWSEAALEKLAGSTNDFDQWRGRIGRFPADAVVEYLAGAEDAAGTNWYDLDGTNHFVFSVTNGYATTWIGDISHSPSNGALTSETNLTLHLYASPSQTLVKAFADYSVNGWIWERIALDFVELLESNELWQAEIVPLPPAGLVWYAFDAEDGAGTIHVRPTNGLPYSATVSGSSTDSDADGLPDDWENFWFGGLTNTSASGNPDGDGLSSLPMDNRMEYVAGTDPAASNALGEIAVLWKPSVPLQGGAMEISAASDVFDGLALTSITASFSDGGSAALGTDGAGRFQNTVLLSETSTVCKIASLSGGGETDDNRGVGWCVPIQLLGEGETADTDGDGMPDAWEMANGLNPLADDAGNDPDLDELTNLEEYLTNTDPNNADTDGDGMPDGWEINSGLNPRSDLIAEGLAAWWRFEEGTGGTASNSVGTNYAGGLQNMDNSNWTNGPLDGALSFDGTDDFVAVQQETSIVTGGAFTVAGLVYLKGDYGENFPTLVSDSKLRLDDYSVALGGVPNGWFGGTVAGSGTTNAATDGNANWSVPSSGNHQQRALFGGSGSANSAVRQRNSFVTKTITMAAAATNRPQEWAFNASYDSSDSTGSSDQNRWRVWLWANGTNLSSANGYAVEYGEDGSNDVVRLFRMNNGAKVTPAIVSGGASVQAGDVQVSVRVQRSVGGVWQMWNLFNTSASNSFPASDPATITNSPQQGTNNTTAVEGTGSIGFQAFINTSASSSRNLALDDLSVNGQITGFNLRHRDAINGGSGDSTNTTFASVSNSVSPYLDRWQSVAFSCDGTNAWLYVAGNPATSVPARFAAALQSQLLIGRDHGETTNSHLYGAIDDLRIYTRALSDTEVGDLYDRLGDADGDGRDNYQEYQTGTDPNNSASFPADISGSIAYSGSQTGFIWVVASPSSSGFPTNRSVKISSPGAFTLPGVPTLDHYWLKAFCDANGDGVLSPCEARGSYPANPVYLTNAIGGISITLLADTNAPALSGVPAGTAVEHGNIPTPPDVAASDSYEGSVSVTFSQTTNTLPDFQLYAGSVAQGLNGCLLSGFTNALAGYGSISHETFSGFAASPPDYAALAATLDDVTCVIQHLDDDGTLDGVIRAFQVEDPVSQGGATGAEAGIDENSGSTTNRNRFVFTFDVPVGFVGLDALDLESSSAGILATLRAYDVDSNLLCETNVIYPNNENGDGQIHFIGLTSDKANIGILTVTVGDVSGDGNSQHLAFDNLRFGTAAAADCEILRVWSAADSCGNGVSATQVIAVVEIDGPGIPDFPDSGPLDPSVWVNELHYDNAGVDTNEGVEVAGWADASLSDYQLVFYSGENGRVYKTVPLSGEMDDEGCGVGAIWFPIPGIQNGPTDGLALVKDELEVKQFLSYEGTLVASNGPAAGLASAPIAVAESATTPLDKSLQLQGEGYDYDAFTWQGPTNATPGSANLAQNFPCPQPPGPRHLRKATTLIEIVGIFRVSNVIEVVVTSTNNAGSIPVDLFSFDAGETNGTFQGLDSFWSLAATNLVLVGTNHVTFTDTGQLGRPPPSAATNRFYAAARSDVDTDTDGLTDGSEIFVYHTDPEDSDTDNDWVDDGAEVDIGTVPTQSNEVVKVWIQFPENGRHLP